MTTTVTIMLVTPVIVKGCVVLIVGIRAELMRRASRRSELTRVVSGPVAYITAKSPHTGRHARMGQIGAVVGTGASIIPTRKHDCFGK